MTEIRSHRASEVLGPDLTPVRSHRGRTTPVTRRGLLGVAAAAAAPAAFFGVRELRDKPVPAGSGGPEASGPAGTTAPATSTPPSAPNTLRGGGPVPYVPGKVLLGSYLDLGGMDEAAALELRRQQLGREQRIVHVFYAWQDSLPESLPWLPDDAYMMLSWRGSGFGPITDGSADALIRRNARRLRRFGRPLMLRWGWEMNGDWYAWSAAKNGNDASGYVQSWRRIHDIFSDEKADNVSFVWSPNWNSSPDTAWNAIGRYYPGDEYVDWVGVSGYNLHREAPAKLFDGIVKAYGTRKPIMITEVGAVDRGGTTKADWITLFARWCAQHPPVGAVTWFDTDTHPGYHEKWRVDTNPGALAAYRAMAEDARFSA